MTFYLDSDSIRFLRFMAICHVLLSFALGAVLTWWGLSFWPVVLTALCLSVVYTGIWAYRFNVLDKEFLHR